MSKSITIEELKNYFMTVNDPQIIEILHCATPSMNKRGNPFPDALKWQHVTGLINFNYEGEVNKQMPKGFQDFFAGVRVWGGRVRGTPLVEHKGEYYLEMLIQTHVTPVKYTHGSKPNEPIDPIVIEPWLKDKPEPEGPFPIPKSFRLSGLLSVYMANGESFTVEG